MKQVVIMRGWPGSGKSTLAKSLFGVICSADNFFVRYGNGVYKYEPDLIPTAHQVCKLEFKNAIDDGEELVIVDNTNIKRHNYQYYVDYAKHKGYKVYQLVPWSEHSLPVSAETCYKRNVHGVPLVTIQKMIREFETDDRLEYFDPSRQQQSGT